LSAYFTIETDFTGYEISSEAVLEWRNLCLDINDFTTDLNNFNQCNLCRDILFIDMLFPTNTAIVLNETFTKDTARSEYLLNFADLIKEENDWKMFFKCLVLRDSLCSKSLTPNLKSIVSVLAKLNVEQMGFLWRAFLEMKVTLMNNKERLNDFIVLYEEIVLYCFEQSVFGLLLGIDGEIMNELVLEYEKESSSSFLDIIFRLDSENRDESNPLWQLKLIHPKVLAIAYLNFLSVQSKSRIAILEEFEFHLRKTSTSDQYQTIVQELLMILNAANELGKFTKDDLMLGYFDILNLCDENLCRLFKFNVQIIFYNEENEEDEEELEEGEEGFIMECLDDVQGGDKIFIDSIREYEKSKKMKFYETRDYSKYQPNIMVFDELFKDRVDDSMDVDENLNHNIEEELRAEMLDRWTFLASFLPYFVFQKSIVQIIENYPSGSSQTPLDALIVEFSFKHALGIQEIVRPILSLLNEQSIKTQPFISYVDHFKQLKDQKNKRELELFSILVNEALSQTSAQTIVPPQLHTATSNKNKNLEYEFKKELPVFQFLKQLLYNSPLKMQRDFFWDILEKIKFVKNSSVDFYQVFLVQLLSTLPELDLVQVCAYCIFNELQPVVEEIKTKFSMRIFRLEFALPFFQIWFMTRKGPGGFLNDPDGEFIKPIMQFNTESKFLTRQFQEIVIKINKLFWPCTSNLIGFRTWLGWCIKVLEINKIAFTSKTPTVALVSLENSLDKFWAGVYTKSLNILFRETKEFKNPEIKSIMKGLFKRSTALKKDLYMTYFEHYCLMSSDIQGVLLNSFEAYMKDDNSVTLFDYFIKNPSKGVSEFLKDYTMKIQDVDFYQKEFWNHFVAVVEKYLNLNFSLLYKDNLGKDSIEKVEANLDLLFTLAISVDSRVLSTVFIQPRILDLLLYLGKILDTKKIMDFIILIYSRKPMVRNQDRNYHDNLWTCHLHSLAKNLNTHKRVDILYVISSLLIDLFNPVKYIESLIPLLISAPPNPKSLTLLSKCEKSNDFVGLIETGIKSWILTTHSKELIDLILIYLKQKNVKADTEIIQYLTDNLENELLLPSILDCFQTIHPMELVGSIKEILRCLKFGSQCVDLLIMIRMSMEFPVQGKGVQWFDLMVEKVVKESMKDMPVGAKALLEKSSLKVRNLF
jgi:hypothetical protein